MEYGRPLDFLDLTLDLLERGAHARVLGMDEDACAGLAAKSALSEDPASMLEDLCRFGWAIEDAFRTAGLHDCVVSTGDILCVRPDGIPASA